MRWPEPLGQLWIERALTIRRAKPRSAARRSKRFSSGSDRVKPVAAEFALVLE
ncbi:MAG: hypothetical protein L6Q99_14540 [Planctomycetes bacterium]|nr:hypothetical protein [Planctomycetota bacterium]